MPRWVISAAPALGITREGTTARCCNGLKAWRVIGQMVGRPAAARLERRASFVCNHLYSTCYTEVQGL